jgi:hypothetical protein
MSYAQAWERMGVGDESDDAHAQLRDARAALRVAVARYLATCPEYCAPIGQVAEAVGSKGCVLSHYARHWGSTILLEIRERDRRGDSPVVLTLHPDLWPVRPARAATIDRAVAAAAARILRKK